MSKQAVKKTLAQKILAIQSEITHVAKNGEVNMGRNSYEYAKEVDFVTTLKPLLEKHGVIVIPEIAAPPTILEAGKDGKSKLTTILMKFKLVNVDDANDYHQALVGGQGVDAGDKGIYKAITGAKKYFIANTFMIPTGDDPEKQTVAPKKGKAKAVALAEDF